MDMEEIVKLIEDMPDYALVYGDLDKHLIVKEDVIALIRNSL